MTLNQVLRYIKKLKDMISKGIIYDNIALPHRISIERIIKKIEILESKSIITEIKKKSLEGLNRSEWQKKVLENVKISKRDYLV